MSRREFVIGGASLLALIAAGCGGSGDGGSASSTSASTPAEPTSGSVVGAAESAIAVPGTFPITITHAFGETVIEEQPERVVTVGVNEQDIVLALGVIPVGVTEWYGEQPSAVWPWAQDELGDGKPTVLSMTDGFQFEKVAVLDPDLIIGTNSGMKREDYTKLSAIAPTLAHSADYDSPYFQPWDVQALAAGRALGKETETVALVDSIKKRFADAANEHPEFAGTSIIFLQNAFYDGNAIAYQDGLSTAFLTDLGFTIPPGLDKFSRNGGQAYIPLEQLSALNAGHVLLWATEKPTDRTNLEQNPLYRQLDAVKAGRLVFTDATTAGAIYFTSLLSLPYVLETLVPALASTLAGNGPATVE